MQPASTAPGRPKIGEKRRGIRVNSRVPVMVEWQDDSGSTVREPAFTRVVGPFGCLMVLPQNFTVGQKFRVINMTTSGAISGVIVWKGSERPEGWELGIELVQPQGDFWGLEL